MQVCMNDLLNFGRMHFFLPDNRLQMDLTTDKTLKEARFDRHYVRDMTWSRHQLEELAEQRFFAAQVRNPPPPQGDPAVFSLLVYLLIARASGTTFRLFWS